jgi:hypothetical protein
LRSGFGQGFKFGNGHGLEFRIGLRVGIRVWDWYRLQVPVEAPAHDGAVDLERLRFALQASGFRVGVPGFRV